MSNDARQVHVELGERSYDITIQQGLLRELGPMLRNIVKAKRVLVVTDRNVGPVFGPALAKSLQVAGFDGSLVELPPGESSKTMRVAECLYDRCFDSKLDRSSCILALGGGVVGDLAGFAAATYMRGIDYVQVPTTLLAMVDSSIGGKVGVDHPMAKNAIGAFHQPKAVLIDPLVLNRLPERELRAGLAEVIKYGIIKDAMFYEALEANLQPLIEKDPEALGEVIERSCEIKAEIVGEDEREREGGSRALLNYGHTFGHAIETCTGYKAYLHGEAISIGMCLAAELSVKQGVLDQEQADRIRALFESAKLPTRLKADDPPAEALHQATFRDKKTRAGQLRFILAHGIGRAVVHDDVPEALAMEIWKNGRA